MKTYVAVEGDTFERISTIRYGVPDFAARIREANPQAAGGIATGMVITVPTLEPSSGAVPLPAPTSSTTEVSVTVAGEVFRFWTELELQRSIDNIDTFTFAAPFEVSNVAFRELFQPMQFREVAINVGGSRLFTGTLVNVVPATDVGSRAVSVSGYAKAGVLSDCTPPGATEALEFDGLDLRQIATELGRPFGLVPTFTADPGPSIDRVAIAPTAKINPFLMKLAQQRNLVIASTAQGMPLYQRETTTPAVQDLTEGNSPVRAVNPEFRPQQFFSHITAITPATIGGDGSQFTVENPSLRGVTRPFAFRADDTFGADSATAAQAKIGRMFANAVAYNVSVAGWEDAAGELWAPNTRVRLFAPGAMIYRMSEFLVRNVVLQGTPSEQSASLRLVLPGSFSGVTPKVFPWQ